MTQAKNLQLPDKIIVIDRFAPLRGHLLTLLSDLTDDDWARTTAATRWTVKDVATHLLGGDIVILSTWRDGFHSSPPIHSYLELVTLVDRLNDEWILAARRL